MHRTSHASVLLIMVTAIAYGMMAGCDGDDPLIEARRPLGEGGWLEGELHEKLESLADQHGTFARSMIEIGYRYQELHWAGADQNWGYAAHQLEELERTLSLAIRRHAEHARAAEVTMTVALPELRDTVVQKDHELYAEKLRQLTANCNACHALTQHPFIQVEPPTQRHSPVRLNPN